MEYLTQHRASFLRRSLLVSSRFGEALRIAQDNMDAQNFYGWNPAFDRSNNGSRKG